jgi:hypothetical protein
MIGDSGENEKPTKNSELSPLNYVFSAPTIAQTIDWLYNKHGIWVQVSISRYGRFYCSSVKKESTKSLDIPFSWEMQNQLNDFDLPKDKNVLFKWGYEEEYIFFSIVSINLFCNFSI